MQSSDIKRVRKNLKLSQKEFGKALGVSLSAVQSWESGSRNMSDTAVKLLKELVSDNSKAHNVSNTISPSLGSSPSIFYNENGETVSDQDISEYVVRNIEKFKTDVAFKKTIDIEALKVLMKAKGNNDVIDIDKIGL